MADTVTGSTSSGIDAHPDFPEFFRQAQQDVWNELGPRIEQAVASGNQGAVERLSAELDRQARQRAVVATRAMLNFHAGNGGPAFNRQFTRSTPTLSGVENQAGTPTPAPTAAPAASMPGVDDLRRIDPSAPLSTSAPTPGSAGPQGRTVADETAYPGALPNLGQRLRGLGAGLALAPTSAFISSPSPAETVAPVPTLAGTETTPTLVRGVDLPAAAAEDPAGAAIGNMLGVGPAFRAAGTVGRAIASSAPVQALGRAMARPAIGVPTALSGSLLATTSEAQAPTALGPRSTEAQTALDAARRRLSDLETRRNGLQARIDRYDPENIVKLNETEIKEAQEAVGANPDGKIGPLTRGAIAAYRRQLQTQIDALRPSEATIRDDIAKAENRRSEAERLDLQEQGRAALEKSKPGFLEEWGPTAGAYIGGGVLGHWFRNWLAGGATRRAEALKREVDTVSGQLGQGDLPTRIGRLNELWTQGAPPSPWSRGTAPPFAFTPSGSPPLQAPSPVAPWSSVTHEIAPGMMGGNMTRRVMSADELYRPGLGTLYGPTAATMGIGGAESIASQAFMLPRAQQAVQDAQAVIDQKGPTPENVASLRSAQQELAFWEALQNAGRGMALGGLSAEMIHPLRSLARPSMAAAEAERGAIDMALHPRAPLPPPGPPPPAPVWDANVGRWRLNGGFVAAPLGPPRRGRP